MAKHDDINENSIEKWVIDSIEKAMPPPSSYARLPRVPKIRNIDIYDQCYVPKVVSIGPYHYNNRQLEFIEKLKPDFMKKLLSPDNLSLSKLVKKLVDVNMVHELRKFYEEKSTDHFSDKVFIKMLLLDGCFILYYILFIYGERAGSCGELRSHQIVFIHQDLFLLENQIPYIVLHEVMNLIKLDHRSNHKIRSFFTDNILLSGKQKRGCFGLGNCLSQNDQNDGPMYEHLLQCLHVSLTRRSDLKQSHLPREIKKDQMSDILNFRSNVRDLVDAGIRFKPSSFMSLTSVEFVRRWWWLSADLKVPPINVDGSTKPMLLNLIAYEMCSDDAYTWVTSYLFLLDTLIENFEDVKLLRKAGVLHNSCGSDKEVATLFNEIGNDLVPNNLAYAQVEIQIQSYYESAKNDWIFGFRLSQLKKEYIKSPWSFLALVGAVMALFLSTVQTYFTVWAPKGDCDDLCMSLKTNHHL